MARTTDFIKGAIVIILAPIVFNVVASIGNMIGSIIRGDFTGNRTGLYVFYVSNLVGFWLVHYVSFYISSNKIYYIIGQCLNLILLVLGLQLQNYEWYYYVVVLVGLFFLFIPGGD